MKERLEGLARIAARRPAVTVAIVLAAALVGGILALGLKPSAGSDTFVGRSSSSYQASQQDHEHFGGDAVVILIKEPLPDLVETKDLATETMLEACLAGQTVVANQQLQSFVPAKAGVGPALRRLQQPVREADAGQGGEGRVRPGDVPQPGRRCRQPPDRGDGRERQEER